MTDINKALKAIKITGKRYTSTSKLGWYLEIDDESIAKIKALVVESLPKEKQMEFVESKPTVTQNDEDRCRFYRYGGYDFAIREIRSIFSE